MINKRKLMFFSIAAAIFGCAGIEKAQDNGGIYVDPNRGEKIYRKTVIMNSNRTESILGNWGMFGHVDDPYSGVWPKGTGHGHIHEMTMLVGADVTGTNGNQYHIISESFSGDPDRAPNGTEYWWNPLPGYANEDRRYTSSTGEYDTTSMIAHSADPTTWPQSWPGKDASWNGAWNGHFGQNQFNADDEAIYVMDDFYNSEFPYYPVPSDPTKRGIGLQVETRLFQWAHPLAQDQIFIHFRVTNQSETNYNDNIYLGAFADTHPGGLGSKNDMNGFSRQENMVYAWAYNNEGIWATYPEILPGYMAWKYLESPGNRVDGDDNDNDGLIDESRDNSAGTKYEGVDNVIAALSATRDLSKFLAFYGYSSVNDIPGVHSGIWWSGDENGNWDPDIDDVGSDGIGSFDPNYRAPDADGSESNGRPDQGEPNFGSLDKDESDQIGLTSFYAPEYDTKHVNDDESIWTLIQPETFQTPKQNANNLWVFASGPFNLQVKQSERFSVCWIFGADQNTIFRNAMVSQNIYNNNYRFSKPPLPPVVKAVPGNHKVTLYWSDLSEKSVDPIYGQDFEGYRIYKGTDAQLTDAQLISDGYGNNAYNKPLAQFDLVDGVKGMHPVALGEELGDQYSQGIHYYMGDDKGLKYYYEDNDVINGVVYYYAVVAYDKGYYEGMDSRNLVNMSPSESAFSFTYDGGLLISQSVNTAIVTPNVPAFNYIPGTTDADENGYINQISGAMNTGKARISIINPDELLPNNQYTITFKDSMNIDGIKQTVSYNVYDETSQKYIFEDSPVPADTGGTSLAAWTTPIFNGMQLDFENVQPSLEKIKSASGWTDQSKTNLVPVVSKGLTDVVAMNATVEITDTLADVPFLRTDKVYFKVYDTFSKEKIEFQFVTDANRDLRYGLGDAIYLLAPSSDPAIKIRAWRITLVRFPNSQQPDTSIAPLNPQTGDKFTLVSDAPFSENEAFQFSTTASAKSSMQEIDLSEISVVPNPYILTAKWERTSALTGRGERKLCFTHLPSECTIRIFTQNGYLIKTINHSGALADGTADWDLTTDEGLEVAFGIYVFHIEAPGIGKKIGTFAIIN